jgi:hypothetical protein
MTDYLLSLISSPKSNGYSIHRLRAVYTDLLRHIDLDNDHLGQRRGIDEKDVECHRKSSRFSFRRSVIPSKDNNKNCNENGNDNAIDDDNNEDSTKIKGESRDTPNSEHFFANPNPHINSIGVCNNKVGLATAFRILAATKSPDKEGENYGAVAIREDSSVCGIQRAVALECRVVELINQIGEIVVNAGGDGHSFRGKNREGLLPVRTDPVFEYFCEKCILSLFVEIAKEVRQGQNHSLESSSTTKPPSSLSVRGVVWSGSVKAQVYQTVSLLISDVRNQSVIYYLLSNNYINELIKCILPLQQWTEQALAKMLPAYIDLLKNLTLQLADDPDLFPFLTIESNTLSDSNDDLQESSTSDIEFPLFSAALETATSVYAQSDSQAYATCLAIILNLMQIPHKPIQTWICQSSVSQRILADHLCQRLLDRYHRMTNLTRGPVVNGARHNSIASQLVSLKDEMGMIHEMFWSGVRGMDVRLCESLLQRVVFVLLKYLLQTPPARPFLVVGLIDADVIPEPEARAQVATVFFSYMFSNLVYVPFQRMLSVALFHQNSTPIWSRSKPIPYASEPSGAYVLMPALSDIVNNEESVETCLNPFRREIFKTLEGDYGEWRTTAAACLLQSVLNTDAIDTDAVGMSGIISSDESTSSLDHSIARFLTRSHKPSAITIGALECTGYLGLMILYRSVMSAIRDEEKTKESIESYLSKSPVWNALKYARDHFCRKATAFRDITGVSDIFLDLTEAVIKNRYTAHFNESGSAAFICHLSRCGFYQNMIEADFLVRHNRCVSANDVETARFYIKMGIHFRALCRVVDRLSSDIETENETLSALYDTKHKEKFDFVEIADTLTRTIGGLTDKLEAGAALDLTGRMFFRFQPAVNSAETQIVVGAVPTESSSEGSINTFYSTTRLMLVLDPTDLFIVKPMVQKLEENRGTILFGISLRNIIAAAVDQAWLHIAIRNPDNIRDQTLIKNGNMALQFESAGTCLVVKQYLDRSREVLRQDLLNKVPDLLQNAQNNTSDELTP